MTIHREQVERWLEDYVAAWKSYDRDAIAALFSDHVEYRYHPWDEPVRGPDAVAAAWLGESEPEGASSRDDAGTYDAQYHAFAVEDDLAVAVGQSSYRETPDGPVTRVFDNCFLLRFDAHGRCSEFTEWFMERPKP